MTCIGNSGPLPEPVVGGAVDQGDLVCAGVLSGNHFKNIDAHSDSIMEDGIATAAC